MEHSKAFENIPMTGVKKEKSLNDVLVRAKVPTEECFCDSCNNQVCKDITKIHQFESVSMSAQFTFSLVTPAMNNTQVALKNF